MYIILAKVVLLLILIYTFVFVSIFVFVAIKYLINLFDQKTMIDRSNKYEHKLNRMEAFNKENSEEDISQ